KAACAALMSIKKHFLNNTVIALIISITACSLIFVPIGRSQDGASNDGPSRPVPPGGIAVEQRSQGTRSMAQLAESFDGLGFGFEGPQGKANLRNPSDNTIAVGPDHIVQIVNSRMAVFTKKGKRFDSTGKILYGPVVTNAVFAGFGGQ